MKLQPYHTHRVIMSEYLCDNVWSADMVFTGSYRACKRECDLAEFDSHSIGDGCNYTLEPIDWENDKRVLGLGSKQAVCDYYNTEEAWG